MSRRLKDTSKKYALDLLLADCKRLLLDYFTMTVIDLTCS